MTTARNRNVQIIFWVSEAEKRMIEEKMTQAGMTNLRRHLRRIAIDGMIVRLELPELKEMVSLLRYASNNINQIARRMNESAALMVQIWSRSSKIRSSFGIWRTADRQACRHQIMELRLQCHPSPRHPCLCSY